MDELEATIRTADGAVLDVSTINADSYGAWAQHWQPVIDQPGVTVDLVKDGVLIGHMDDDGLRLHGQAAAIVMQEVVEPAVRFVLGVDDPE